MVTPLTATKNSLCYEKQLAGVSGIFVGSNSEFHV